MTFDAAPFLDGLYAKAKRSLSVPPEASALAEWKVALTQTLARLLGMDRLPKRNGAARTELLEESESDGFVVRRVLLDDGEGYRLPCYAVFPKTADGGPLRAAVALHGHGYGSRSAVGLPPKGSAAPFDQNSGLDFALKIAARGFAVAAPELLGFGDRRLPEMALSPPEEKACERIASLLTLYGETLAARRVYDGRLALDYLLSLEGVKKDGAAAMGFSGGAMICMLLSIFDGRIQRAAVCGYPNLFKTSIIAMRHCIDNYIPGILDYAEMPDLLSLIAPRPLFLSSGINDPIFPVDGAREAYRYVKQAYELYGAEENLVFEIFEGGHQISGAKVYDWIAA
jgi:predicted esterase